MSLKKLPQINAKAPVGVKWDIPSSIESRWNGSSALAKSDDATITVHDVIGYDDWSGGGVTEKRISAALRSIGDRDVTVSINSKGGDFFEGIAIYNLLREHPHKITVKVVGLAASAASIIAMAGDEVQVAKAGFLMVHNAWVFAIGNRHDLREAADVLDEFDGVMAQLYADATGISTKESAKLMDEETWMSGQSAVDLGFATSLLSADEVIEDGSSSGTNSALRKIETILTQQGMPRAERRSLLREITGSMPGAASNAMPGAGGVSVEDIANLTNTLKGLSQC